MTASGAGDGLLAGWRRTGIEAGMHLIVHSALSSLGHVDGGSATVLTSLQAAVGSHGTLVVPAFTPQVTDPHPEVRGVPSADVRMRREQVPLFTPDLPSSMGAISEQLRLTPGAVRSGTRKRRSPRWGPAPSRSCPGNRCTSLSARDLRLMPCTSWVVTSC